MVLSTILSPFVKIFEIVFDGIHSLVQALPISEGAGYILAVFLLTLLVRVLLLPLNIKQMKSQVAMQEVQPKVAQLQKKYKNNPEKVNQEMMKLYKEYKINPMSGCLPLLLQMPILFSLYYVFINVANAQPQGQVTNFLFIKNIWQAGPGYSLILAIVSALTTYLSSYIMSKSSGTANAEGTGMNMNTMNVVMAGMMGFMAINFSPMLVMYWIMGNLIQIGQTYLLVVLPKKRKEKLANAS